MGIRSISKVKIVRGNRTPGTVAVPSNTEKIIPRFYPRRFFLRYPDLTGYVPSGKRDERIVRDAPFSPEEFIELCGRIAANNVDRKQLDPNISPNRQKNYVVAGSEFKFHGKPMQLEIQVCNRDDGFPYFHGIGLVSSIKYVGGERIYGRFYTNGPDYLGNTDIEKQLYHPEIEQMLLDFIREAMLRGGRIDI
jgi:hypothetical protein